MTIDTSTSLNTGNTNARSTTARSEAVRPTSNTSAEPTPNPVSSDSVSLSPQAQSISRLESAVANVPDVDSARIDAIREAIDSGQYQIDPEAIADSIIAQDNLV